MASDISNIINSELINTFESLLSLNSSIDDISLSSVSEIDSEQCIKISMKIETNGFEGSWIFYIPTLTATKFEYFMLGGIGELKTSIDDEVLDATKEIINTIGGSLATSINAQDFEDLNSVSFTMKSGEIVQVASIGETSNLYKFNLLFNDEKVNLFIDFDKQSLKFINKIVSNEEATKEDEQGASDANAAITPAAASILSLLGEESVENLKLLFNVKLKLSVRLGTKTFLLRDIVNWDIGQIIELEQMVNEPLDILINGIKIGEGEAVIVEGRFGVKIKYIGEKKIEI